MENSGGEYEFLYAAISRLGTRQRLAIELVYLSGLDVESARKEIGLSRSGFYKLLEKSRENLRTLLRKGVESHERGFGSVL